MEGPSITYEQNASLCLVNTWFKTFYNKGDGAFTHSSTTGNFQNITFQHIQRYVWMQRCTLNADHNKIWDAVA